MASDQRADAVRNRERVLAAARAELAEGGLVLPMNQIARRAGVGVGTVYRHFPTRHALLEALVVDSLGPMARDADAARQESDPRVAMTQLIRSALAIAVDNPGVERVLAEGEPQNASALALMASFAEAADELVARGQAGGVIRAGVSGDDIRRLVCGMAHAAVCGPDARRRLDTYVEILVGGLRATREEDP
jgi:AcrR family transcriptional regulator